MIKNSYDAVHAAGMTFPFPRREVRLLRDTEVGQRLLVSRQTRTPRYEKLKEETMTQGKFKMRRMGYARAAGHIVLLSLMIFLPGVAPRVCAQQSQEILNAVTRQMGQSMKDLTGYSYQQRTELQVNGETKSVQLSQVSFGPDKQPLLTPLSSSPAEEPGRGLRGRIKKEKAEEMKEEVEHLVQLANSYLMPSQGKMQQLVNQGQALVNPDSGNVRVEVGSFLEPGDHMIINCDGMMKNRTQVQVQTTTGGNPMTINALYQTLPAGLNYNIQTTISVPAKGLQIMINTMNYQKQ